MTSNLNSLKSPKFSWKDFEGPFQSTYLYSHLRDGPEKLWGVAGCAGKGGLVFHAIRHAKNNQKAINQKKAKKGFFSISLFSQTLNLSSDWISKYAKLLFICLCLGICIHYHNIFLRENNFRKSLNYLDLSDGCWNKENSII